MADKIYIRMVQAGCYSAMLDCDDYRELFLRNGLEATDRLEEASYILVHTCITSGFDERSSLKMIGDIYEAKHPEAQVIIGGCMNASLRGRILGDFASPIFPPHNLRGLQAYLGFIHGLREDRLRDRLEQQEFGDKVKSRKRLWYLLNASQRTVRMLVPPLERRMRRFFNTTHAYSPRAYLIRVSTGCPNRCSFCQIWMARSRAISREIPAILAEVERACARGYDHFVLVADDLASYGLDRGESFPALLRALFSLPCDFTLTLYNFNPIHTMDHLADLIEAIVPGRVLCIHYVLQSGSDRILRAMNRPYTCEQYVASARAILHRDPGISLRSDVIVGFPGETEEEFLQTQAVVESLPFETLNVYSYSDRPGTPAVSMAEQIPEPERVRRRRRLQAVYRLGVLKRYLQAPTPPPPSPSRRSPGRAPGRPP